MSPSVDRDQILRLARHLASLGREKVEQFQLVVNEARLLVDVPEQTLSEERVEAHPWERTEPASDQPKAIYLATVEDYATGEGLTVGFAAVLAHGEDEARRYLSRIWSRNLAHLAILARGADAIVPFARLFLSPELRANLQRIEAGEGRPAVFSYQARYHMNMS